MTDQKRISAESVLKILNIDGVSNPTEFLSSSTMAFRLGNVEGGYTLLQVFQMVIGRKYIGRRGYNFPEAVFNAFKEITLETYEQPHVDFPHADGSYGGKIRDDRDCYIAFTPSFPSRFGSHLLTRDLNEADRDLQFMVTSNPAHDGRKFSRGDELASFEVINLTKLFNYCAGKFEKQHSEENPGTE